MTADFRFAIRVALWTLAGLTAVIHFIFRRQLSRVVKEKYPDQAKEILGQGAWWMNRSLNGMLFSKKTANNSPVFSDDLIQQLRRVVGFTGILTAVFVLVASYLE